MIYYTLQKRKLLYIVRFQLAEGDSIYFTFLRVNLEAFSYFLYKVEFTGFVFKARKYLEIADVLQSCTTLLVVHWIPYKTCIKGDFKNTSYSAKRWKGGQDMS